MMRYGASLPPRAASLLLCALAAQPSVGADPKAAPPVERCPAGTARERIFSFALGSNRAGFQTECIAPDGTREYVFAFNDRGRGPALRERISLDPRGIPTRLQVDGHDYLKSPIAERYSLADGKTVWKNKVEEGASASPVPAFYWSQSGVPAETALLARALLTAPGRRLPLLPQGEARIEELEVRTVKAGNNSRRVTLYGISGLGFQPVTVWLAEDRELFGIVERWSELVPEGFEPVSQTLLTAQEARLAATRREQSQRLRRLPAKPVVIEHARLFDPETRVIRPGTTVVVEGNSIRDVGPDGTIEIPPAAQRIDAKGRALVPGLWDMHSHPELPDGLLLLAGGVTTVRDMAAAPEKARQLAAWKSGAELGPRLVFAGIIDGPGPFQGPTPVLVDTDAEARSAVRAIDEAGFGLVKIYSSVKPELVPAIVDEAHKRGLRVGGHVPAFMTAEQAVAAGFDEIQHMNMLFLNFLFDDVPDTRTPARLTAVAERAAELDLAAARTKSFISLLASRKVTVDPTLQVFENLITDRPGKLARAWAAVADRMPPVARRGMLEGGLPVPEGKDARYQASFRAMLRMLKALHEAGVPIVAGTDAIGGFALVRELELYVEAGIPAAEVLQMATLGAARAVGQDERLGSIEPGKLADMILVDGDPSANPSDLRKLRLVVKDGVALDPEAIWRELGILPLGD